MKKLSKDFWILYITFTVVLTFSLFKITQKQINKKFLESQENQVRRDVNIKQVEAKPDDNPNIEIVNPPEEPKPEEPVSDYWYYINQPLISVDFNTLMSKNSDTVAWLQLHGTNINYPVVQTTDNDYYLEHAYDKTYNLGGWVFMDYRNNPVDFGRNTIIYGHGMANDTIFGTLRYIIEPWWYNDAYNHTLNLSTSSENTLWQVFSVYTIPEESYYIRTAFDSDEEYVEFLNTLKNRSVNNFNTDLNANDKIITLSSCYNDELRVVLHAKLIKREYR